MGLIVITAYLRPPEKWSLFGRKWSLGIVVCGLMWTILWLPGAFDI